MSNPDSFEARLIMYLQQLPVAIDVQRVIQMLDEEGQDFVVEYLEEFLLDHDDLSNNAVFDLIDQLHWLTA